MKPDTSLAKDLAMRWALQPQAVAKWLKARGFTQITDLMQFGMVHAEAMEKAQADFWQFHMNN